MHRTMQFQFKDLPHFYTTPGKRLLWQLLEWDKNVVYFTSGTENTGYLLLVDTDAQISVIPPDPNQKHALST